METDSLSLVKILKSQESAQSYVGIICEDIKKLLSQVNIFLIEFVPRKGNEVAHRLAQLELSCCSKCRWFESVPVIISDVLSNDLS